VLDAVSSLGKPVSVRDLVQGLSLESEAEPELKSVLGRLIEAGALVEIRGGRFGLPDRMNLVVGRLSCSPSGYGFVVPEKRSEGQPDLFVAAANIREALHGDRVVARVERHGQRGPEGRIIRVLERVNQRIVGRYESDGRSGGRVVPFDRRVLHEVFVAAGDEGGAAGGVMVTAEITRPPTATRNPVGRVTRVIGPLSDPGVDLEVVVAKYGLPDRFPPAVESEAERVARPVSAADTAGRTDFRSWLTVTIDPETARDHDDAVSIEPRPDGGYRLAVHIADVAHYVREGGAVDEEAYLRGTSVYFPDRVVPMLPHALSSDVCSLVEGQDRLTQTAVIDVDARGRVERSVFHDGVIRSAARLSYQQAQAIVEGDPAARERFAALVPALVAMDELAKLMRARRHERGSLDFDLPEPKLVLDASGEMTAIVRHERLDSMRLIEEFMLAANEAVAEALHKAGAGALYRVHEQPDPERIEEFSQLVASLGYRMPENQETVRPEHFQLILRQIEGKPEEKLISYLLLRTMKLARYHEENLGHFGLATEMYAHFTSPIRRYPDLVVHRALLRAIGQGDDPRPDDLQVAAEHTSETERAAADIEYRADDICAAWLLERTLFERGSEESFAGEVIGLIPSGLFARFGDVFEGFVPARHLRDDYYELNELGTALVGRRGGQRYRLGDELDVRVEEIRRAEGKIELAPTAASGSGRGGGRRGRSGRPRSR
jgi:ribonuclease R